MQGVVDNLCRIGCVYTREDAGCKEHVADNRLVGDEALERVHLSLSKLECVGAVLEELTSFLIPVIAVGRSVGVEGRYLLYCLVPSSVGRNQRYIDTILVLNLSASGIENVVVVEEYRIYVHHLAVFVHRTFGTTCGPESFVVNLRIGEDTIEGAVVFARRDEVENIESERIRPLKGVERTISGIIDIVADGQSVELIVAEDTILRVHQADILRASEGLILEARDVVADELIDNLILFLVSQVEVLLSGKTSGYFVTAGCRSIGVGSFGVSRVLGIDWRLGSLRGLHIASSLSEGSCLEKELVVLSLGGIEGAVERSPHRERLGLVEETSKALSGIAVILILHDAGTLEEISKFGQLGIALNVLPNGLIASHHRIIDYVEVVVGTGADP